MDSPSKVLTPAQIAEIEAWNEKDRARYAIVKQPALHVETIAALLESHRALESRYHKALSDLVDESRRTSGAEAKS